jgi:hypothetical protein
LNRDLKERKDFFTKSRGRKTFFLCHIRSQNIGQKIWGHEKWVPKRTENKRKSPKGAEEWTQSYISQKT